MGWMFLVVTQDEANRHGGKWIIRLKKGLASRCWENLVLAMLGEQFMVGDEICGAVISLRYQVRPCNINLFCFKYFPIVRNISTLDQKYGHYLKRKLL